MDQLFQLFRFQDLIIVFAVKVKENDIVSGIPDSFKIDPKIKFNVSVFAKMIKTLTLKYREYNLRKRIDCEQVAQIV